MKTPIYDFVTNYTTKKGVRFHMPGHKGLPLLGYEDRDLTEIRGADELYHPDGIIAESEKNAAILFGSGETCFSTEGSSQCIRAMLSLAISECKERPCILAARNVHKAFVYSAALLDFDVEWMYPQTSDSLCSCMITADKLEHYLLTSSKSICAVYITSPDYLGNIADIRGLSVVCNRYHALLLVDNAHGAYLHFLNPPMHPLDLGADMCCDSAHKTLPALTGTAYLHIHKRNLGRWNVKKAMEMFGSTSPSYLLLQSLDCVNAYLAADYSELLNQTVSRVIEVKSALKNNGWFILDGDVLRITLDARKSGWNGNELADFLRKGNMECEYADPDYVVLMVTPSTTPEELTRLTAWLGKNHQLSDDGYQMPIICPPRAISIRQAMFAPSHAVPLEKAEGKICGAPTVSCPPAIPLVISGEIIEKKAIEALRHYGIEEIDILAIDSPV